MRLFYDEDGLKKNEFLHYLMTKHHQNIYLNAITICKKMGFTAHQVDDFMQDYYEAIWKNMEKVYAAYITRQEKFYTYLIGMIRNCIYEAYRKEKSKKRLEALYTLNRSLTVELQMWSQEEQFERFLYFLDSILLKKEIEIMEYYMMGNPYKEISKKTGLKVNTVASMIHRVKKEIGQYVKRTSKFKNKEKKTGQQAPFTATEIIETTLNK